MTTAPAPLAQAARILPVDAESAGQRLDNFLMRHLKGVPKTHVYRLIRSGQVRVNKGRASADTRVQAGDAVRLPPVRMAAPAPSDADSAPAREFPVLLEDDSLIAIHKPAGVAVHGGSGVSFGVIEQLRRARRWGQPGGAHYLELAHRLDRETSGILLVAKKRSALKQLQEQFRQRQTGKTYLALVQGSWPERIKLIDQPLRKYLLPAAAGQSEGERRVQTTTADDPQAMRAITLVKVQQRLPGFTLLQVTIKTGRTHQIRVHLAHLGHPLLADALYGGAPAAGMARQALHARRLALAHPITGQPLDFAAPLPADMAAALAAWGMPAQA